MGVDVFFSASFTFVAASLFSVSSGLVAPPTTSALVDDAAVATEATDPDVDFVVMFVDTVSTGRVLVRRRSNICEHCAIQQNKLHVTT